MGIAKENKEKLYQEKIKLVGYSLLGILLFLTPFVVPAGIQANQKLQKTSWQELKENEKRYGELSICTDSLKRIESAATNNLVYSLLKEGNTCLNSFVEKDNIAYLNLLYLEEAIGEKGIENINAIKETIKENKIELQSGLIWSTQSGFIFLLFVRSIAWGFFFWLILACTYQNWLLRDE